MKGRYNANGDLYGVAVCVIPSKVKRASGVLWTSALELRHLVNCNKRRVYGWAIPDLLVLTGVV